MVPTILVQRTYSRAGTLAMGATSLRWPYHPPVLLLVPTCPLVWQRDDILILGTETFQLIKIPPVAGSLYYRLVTQKLV